MARPMDFSNLQPKWAGEEPSVKVDSKTFFAELMKESPAQQMITRGYAVVSLAPEIMKTYDHFYEALALFCKQSLEAKLKFAQLKNGTKMDDSKFTPNQFHGYSQMQGLKEQFMIRAPGRDTDLYLPGIVGENHHFGDLCLRLYEQLDLLGRDYLHQVVGQMGLRKYAVDRVLDPINKVGVPPLHEETSLGSKSSTDYVHTGFISTSILDVFHYFNNFRSEEADQDDQFHNNHASHTDSGIVTIVPTADEPGLEVLDQKMNKWIHLEKIVHEAVGFGAHRAYACIFFGDSCEYVSKTLKPLFHRVARCQRERYSIVFKMRTAPLVTAPRYQEDYLLAGQQLKAMDVVHACEARERNKKIAIGAAITIGVVVTAAGYLKFRQTSANVHDQIDRQMFS